MSSDAMLDRGLQSWVARIRDKDMPVFGKTVQSVRQITEDETASASVLASVILQDAALTAKVLKLANSAVFNPGLQPVNTVSRAIVAMGFNMVGNLVLSISLIDAFVSGDLRGRVVKEMARCFHAAVQARTAAKLKGLQLDEEVFIAALLGRVGEIAFWCFGAATAEQLDEMISSQPDEKPEDLQMDVLGFRLKSLTVELSREWHLSGISGAAEDNSADAAVAAQAIALSYKLAEAVEHGWDSPAAKTALAAYASFVGKPVKDIAEQVARNAAEAAKVAAHFGAEAAARAIPLPPRSVAVDYAAEVARPEADAMLQLKILRELSSLLAGKPGLNEVLQLVLEGIYRGLGMSHAVFALQTADRQRVVAKAALGHESAGLLRRFNFALTGARGDVINDLFSKSRAYWLAYPPLEPLHTTRLEEAAGSVEAFMAPIVASGRVIGLFYADRGGAACDDESWQGFQHFAQQASLCFEYVATHMTRRQ